MPTCLGPPRPGQALLLAISLFALTGGAALTGCGGSPVAPGGNGDNGGDGGGAGLTSTVDLADQASDRFDSLCSEMGWPAAATAFAAYAESLSGVAQVAVHPASSDVTLVYDSGIAHIFHHPQDDDGPGGAVVSARGAAGLRVAPASARAIPSSTRAAVGTGLSPDVAEWSDVAQGLETVRRACERAGYQVSSSYQLADVAWFDGWDQYGLIYFHGHGGFGAFEDTDGSNVVLYALRTSESYRVGGDVPASYAADLAARRLVFFSAGPYMRNLGLTSRFFSAHCSPMQPGAIVYINACKTLMEGSDVASTLNGLGAQMVLGWNSYCPRVYGSQLAGRLFDLCCALGTTQPLDPPLRPFTVDQVFDYCDEQGMFTPTWTSDAPRAGSFECRRASGATTVSARPVVSDGYFVPAADTSMILLHGYFGEAQGTARLGETALDILSWTPNQVVLFTPQGDRSLRGDIVVEQNGLESAPLRLTRYTGTVDVEVDEPEGKWSGTVHASFAGRAIVHRMRDEINGTPVTLATPPTTLCRLWIEEGFDMNWDISGSWSRSCDDPPWQTTYEVSASGSMSEQDAGGGIGSAFSAEARFNLDADPPTYQIEFWLMVDGDQTWSGCSSGDSTWSEIYQTHGVLAARPMAADGVIPSGSYSEAGFTIRWSEIVPDVRPPWGEGDDAYLS